MEPHLLDVRSLEDLPRAFNEAATQLVKALVVGNDTAVLANRRPLVELAVKHRLPTIFATREYVDTGGLASYAVHYASLYERAAIYVDKIFKGARPADLPIEQPTKLQLIFNLRTAKALGLEVPPILLTRADEVIE
jgi:putative ABC transport system substrate-binding protein